MEAEGGGGAGANGVPARPFPPLSQRRSPVRGAAVGDEDPGIGLGRGVHRNPPPACSHVHTHVCLDTKDHVHS